MDKDQKQDLERQAHLCFMLLAGYCRYDKDGLPRTEYFVEGSEEEREAREALAALFRGPAPLDRELRKVFAALRPRTAINGALWRRAQDCFAFRKEGRGRDDFANTTIAQHVWEAVRAGSKVHAGIISASERFGKDTSTIEKIWGRYRAYFRALWGGPPTD